MIYSFLPLRVFTRKETFVFPRGCFCSTQKEGEWQKYSFAKLYTGSYSIHSSMDFIITLSYTPQKNQIVNVEFTVAFSHTLHCHFRNVFSLPLHIPATYQWLSAQACGNFGQRLNILAVINTDNSREGS